MKDHDVVVIGGGSTGCSILYHLVKIGDQGAAARRHGPAARLRADQQVDGAGPDALQHRDPHKDGSPRAIASSRTSGRSSRGAPPGTSRRGSSSAPTRPPSSRSGERGDAQETGIDSRIMKPEELAASGIEPMLNTNAFSLFAYEPNAGYAEPSTTASSFASAAVETRREDPHRSARHQDRARLSQGQAGYSVLDDARSGQLQERRDRHRSLVEAALRQTGHGRAPEGVEAPGRHLRPARQVPGHQAGGLRLPPIGLLQARGQRALLRGTLAHELDASGEDADPDAYDEGITYEEAADFSESAAAAFPVMAARDLSARIRGPLRQHARPAPHHRRALRVRLPGVYCVVGLSGHGFKLAPEFGRIIASLVVGGKFPDYDVSVFKLRRFEDGRPTRRQIPGLDHSLGWRSDGSLSAARWQRPDALPFGDAGSRTCTR